MRTATMLFLMLGWMACAPNTLQTAELVPVVTFSDGVKQFISLVQLRMTGHPVIPDQEILSCITGTIRGNQIEITGVLPTRLTRIAPGSVSYEPCPRETLGTWHSHPPNSGYGDGCWFSTTDMEAFMSNEHEWVQVVSCQRGDSVTLLSRVKKGYSTR